MIELGVNVDHVATVRQARRTYEPDPVWAAIEAHLGGADGITVHLREDRRHIHDEDVRKECERLGAELGRISGLIDAQQKKLANEQFVSRAPAAVVDGERAKLLQFEQQAASLREKREQLGC